MLNDPATFTFEDIRRLPKRELESFHQCAGFPRNPRLATRRVANVVWGGASVASLLKDIGPDRSAEYLWAFGLDHGTYEGHPVDTYVKDIPLRIIPTEDLLLAYEINGEPLSAELGYPLRLVAPGFYGTNSVKWLCRLELGATRAPGPFTNEFYNDPVKSESGEVSATTKPVWEAPPESAIVEPAPDSRLSGPVTVWGRAWGYGGVSLVEISFDEGETWKAADLTERAQHSWQSFHFVWRPEWAGKYVIAARATNHRGETQPMADARNAVHRVSVEIVVDAPMKG